MVLQSNPSSKEFSNSRLIQALHCKNVAQRPPVWLMRQAGRYMPEFRKIRAQYSFLEVCHNPELAAEVTLLPIKAFHFDAAILFSDILVIPEALEVGLHFEDHRGPVIDRPIQKPSDVEALPQIALEERLDFVAKTIQLLLPRLEVPLIGFSGAPFTLASYMIEGGSSKDLKKTKQWLLQDPESFHRLLSLLADYVIKYMHLQVEAGVQAFQLFDSWANVLAHAQFREFSLHYLQRLAQEFKSTGIPLIFFCRGASVFASDLAEASPSAISLDWNADISTIRRSIPKTIALQGNLDPDILYAPHKLLKKEILHLLKQMNGDPGYIFNLGHGIHPDTPVDAVKTLVETVQSYTPYK